MRPETMIVDTDNGPVMINKSEFDSNIHRVKNGGEPVQTLPGTQPAAPLGFDANGNPVNAGDGGWQQPIPLRQDGPTVEEYVASGYDAANYPPNGYASRSTPEQIEAAKQAKQEPQQQTPPPAADAGEYLVTKSADGKKFIVIDKNAVPVQRDGIDPKGYKTEDDAWTAVKAL